MARTPAGSATKSPQPPVSSSEPVGALELVDNAIQHLEGSVPVNVQLHYGTYTIGRASNANIQIKAQLDGKFIISRLHAQLEINEHEFLIRDLNSTNGVFVNDQRVSICKLHDGDTVRFAGMSDVPIGAYLTTSNVSVMYKVHLYDDSIARFQRLRMKINEPVTNVNTPISTSKFAAISSSSKRSRAQSDHDREVERASEENITKKIRVAEPVQHVPINTVSANTTTSSSDSNIIDITGDVGTVDTNRVLEEIKALRELHTKELEEMKSKFDLLYQQLSSYHDNTRNGSNYANSNTSSNIDRNGGPSAAIATTSAVTSAGNTNALQQMKIQSTVFSLPPSSPIPSLAIKFDLSSISSVLTCAICHDTLVLPVILPCSHGYCAYCIVDYIEKGKHTCPTCCDPPTSGNKRVFHRSDHLDQLVYVVLEGSAKPQQQVSQIYYIIWSIITNADDVYLLSLVKQI
jgi:hypothetical protein